MEASELQKAIAENPERVREILCGLETKTNAPICRTVLCKRPLTWLEDAECWRCLVCNPIPKPKPVEEKEDKRIDVRPDVTKVEQMIRESEARMRNIVRDSIAEFMIKPEPDPDYPPTHAEITQIAGSVYDDDEEEEESAEAVSKRVEESLKAVPNKMPWLAEAKKFGVATHLPDGGGMRKKAEILADIEKAKGVTDGGSSTIEN